MLDCMFVITADQINSRGDVDRVPTALTSIADLEPGLVLPYGRFAGDELQFITDDAHVALELVLRLTRSEHWSVGLGVGAVRLPLPDTAAAATGPAFISAREAISAAKRSATGFALRGPSDAHPTDDETGALVDLLLTLRTRRSEEGWSVCDLMDTGITQTAVATILGITPQAVSLRLRTAGWRIEERARRGLVVLLRMFEERAADADAAIADAAPDTGADAAGRRRDEE